VRDAGAWAKAQVDAVPRALWFINSLLLPASQQKGDEDVNGMLSTKSDELFRILKRSLSFSLD